MSLPVIVTSPLTYTELCKEYMFTLFIMLVLSCRPALILLPLGFCIMPPAPNQGCTLIQKCDTAVNGIKPLSYAV